MILISFFVSCRGEKKSPPIIDYRSKVINLGHVRVGVENKDSFVIRNIGESDLHLIKISTDCQCTVTDNSPKTIKAHDSVSLSFSVKPSIPGLFQQKIIIENNTVEENPVMLIVRGNAMQ